MFVFLFVSLEEQSFKKSNLNIKYYTKYCNNKQSNYEKILQTILSFILLLLLLCLKYAGMYIKEKKKFLVRTKIFDHIPDMSFL